MLRRSGSLSTGLFLWLLVLWLSLPVLASESLVAVPSEHPLIDLTFGQLMLLFTNLGLGVIVFIIWLWDQRRQTSMKQLIARYNEAQQAHLAAFRDINERNLGAIQDAMENYRELAKEMNQIMAANIEVQTRLVERLRERSA